jgi:hypothetical protein
MLAATGAEFGELEAASGRLLVLGGGVVPLFADSALEGDDFAHGYYSSVWPATSAGKQRVVYRRHAATQGLMAPAAKILIVVTESERSGHALTLSIIHETGRLAKWSGLAGVQKGTGLNPSPLN